MTQIAIEKEIHAARIEEGLAEVSQETERQVAKWGVQHHPDGTGGPGREWLATHAKQMTDARAAEGTVTWYDILREEVYEAAAESDPEKLITELTQVAAVALSWAADVKGRRDA